MNITMKKSVLTSPTTVGVAYKIEDVDVKVIWDFVEEAELLETPKPSVISMSSGSKREEGIYEDIENIESRLYDNLKNGINTIISQGADDVSDSFYERVYISDIQIFDYFEPVIEVEDTYTANIILNNCLIVKRNTDGEWSLPLANELVYSGECNNVQNLFSNSPIDIDNLIKKLNIKCKTIECFEKMGFSVF